MTFFCDPGLFRHRPLVLHLSLRDLAPEIILGACNVTDDVAHVMKAQTSLHHAEQQIGHETSSPGRSPRL